VRRHRRSPTSRATGLRRAMGPNDCRPSTGARRFAVFRDGWRARGRDVHTPARNDSTRGRTRPLPSTSGCQPSPSPVDSDSTQQRPALRRRSLNRHRPIPTVLPATEYSLHHAGNRFSSGSPVPRRLEVHRDAMTSRAEVEASARTSRAGERGFAYACRRYAGALAPETRSSDSHLVLAVVAAVRILRDAGTVVRPPAIACGRVLDQLGRNRRHVTRRDEESKSRARRH